MAANDVPCCETMFWVYLVICVALVCFAGLMSGLTLGLMSLSLVDLEVLIKAGRPEDRKNAEKILPIVKNQHLLLCSLLIWNALAMEALPIFVDALLPAWGAILISVTLILAFGEIIPQSICSRYGLNIGARLSVVVRLLVIIVFPIAYPISKGHSALLRRAELKTLIDMHGNEAGKGGELTHDETTIISGVLDLTEKTAKDAMTPLSRVFSLDLTAKLDSDTMSLIISKGHSRIPIYSETPTNIVGLVLVKNLIKHHPEDRTEVRNLSLRRIPRFYECLPLYDILNQFQKGQSHMAVVVKNTTTPFRDVLESTTGTKINVDGSNTFPNTNEEVIGIITMEDVLEELLQGQIFDETDEYVDVHNKIKINLIPSVKLSSKSPYSSSSHQTRSPVSPYTQSPITRASLSASPGNSSSTSPLGITRPFYGSPSTYQMSSGASGCSEGSLNDDDLLEIRARFEERMESHAKTLHEAREEDKKHIEELERELSNCSQEIGEQVCSLQLKLADMEDLAEEVGRLREQMKILESERLSLIQEIEDKEVAITSVGLEYQCEIESTKLESIALEQNLCEINKLLEKTTQENSKLHALIQDLEFRIQDANKVTESLVKENKDLKEKLQQMADEKFQEWLEINGNQSLSTPEKDTSTYGNTLYPKAPDVDLRNKIDEYELLVKQLKEEIRKERLKGIEEAEDLIQEMAELRYQLTARLDEECKRRANIEQISLHRIAELEAQIGKQEKKSIIPEE
ncbi:hypothetical protein RD792_013809 [Penstemon davidsonii]|uniref:Uncharacterized protein n=1 Tax=Penstemon davidsonii TaxID=160366 RepID=A0ABR0CUJ9_9LAMI|nr:hypothetical protein RD792_013809 [Penstemon davidsonii]